MVDEDCGDLKYCLYEIENSKCLPCIPTDMVSTQLQLVVSVFVVIRQIKAAPLSVFTSTVDQMSVFKS